MTITRYEVLTECGTKGVVVEMFGDLKGGDKRVVEFKDERSITTFQEMKIKEILTEETF